MIDVCFSCCVENLLEEIETDINSNGILSLMLNLNYGSLDCDIVEEQTRISVETLPYRYRNISEQELQEEYNELLEQNKQDQEDLITAVTAGEELRVWVNNDANDRCGLFWLCYTLQKYKAKICTVVCPGYTYSFPSRQPYENRRWAFCDPDFMKMQLNKTHFLNEDEILAYSERWEYLVKDNSNFRILIDDFIVGVSESFFDNTILSFVKTEPQTQYSIMGNMLGKFQGGCDVAFISKRIDHLINEGLIRVCKEYVDENDCYWHRTLSLNQ